MGPSYTEYRCVNECKSKPFTRLGSLEQHQKACAIYNTTQRRRRQQRMDASSKPDNPYNFARSQKSVWAEKRANLMGSNTVASSSKLPLSTLSSVPENDTPSLSPQAASTSPQEFSVEPFPSDANFDMPVDDPPPHHSSSPPPTTTTGRPRRNHILPLRFRDIQPQPLEPILPDMLNTAAEPAIPGPRRVILLVRDRLMTVALNAFGLWREYPHRPSYDPDALLRPEDLSNFHDDSSQATPINPDSLLNVEPNAATLASTSFSPPWPFANMTCFRLMSWANNGHNQKSEAEVDKLVNDVILSPHFKQDDLKGFRCHSENVRMDTAAAGGENPLLQAFKETRVSIDVPSGDPNVPSQQYSVPGLWYRKITDVIHSAFAEPLAHQFHFSPFRLFHHSQAGKDTRVYSELYNSDAFLQAHDDVHFHGKIHADNAGCTLEKVIAALIVFSDATHLAQFGNAKAWPIYLAFGNLSKYFRSRPSSGAMHHLAYVPSLPDSFQDFARTFHCKWKTQKRDILAHCRRELMHAVWNFLLDPDFIHAYHYGMVIDCLDGVRRRIYPRIFTYSADYPEKVLLATIRDNGLCPCPRCLVLKENLDLLGQKRDGKVREKNIRTYLLDRVHTARKAIYFLGRAIGGSVIDNLLKSTSHVPTLNAFINRIGPDFNAFRMLVVDQLHEFELGVWKALFTHLIRLLYAEDPSGELVSRLNLRYRQIAAFGRGTIRKFAENSAEMKKLAARDFEDLLQCAIPVFEGLLPEPFNSMLLTLLYRVAEWHALAKLRMHTEQSLSWLETSTQIFGRLMRQFRDQTSHFDTVELPREAAARERAAQTAAERRAPQHTQATGNAGTSTETVTPRPQASSARRPRKLNLNTFKFHSLGDYVASIRLFGTTDSYSTQMGELAHRLIKNLYGLTNKKNAMAQVAKKYARMHALQNMYAGVSSSERIAVAASSFDIHHFISDSRNEHFDVFKFVMGVPDPSSSSSRIDPAKKNFIPKLQDHLLGRLMEREFDGDTHETFTKEQRNSVRIVNNRIYLHHIMRVNYTTYDVRRDYDTINPSRYAFVMVKSPEMDSEIHPYWYAQVLGIYHADVQHFGVGSVDLRPRVMHFLWVRWLGDEPGWKSGRKFARLPKVGFVPDTDDYAFGFLDPSVVIRGVHLLPDFCGGRTAELLQTMVPTIARKAEEEEDWVNYYVNIFVDRDMVMRYFGGGIGHLGTGLSPSPENYDEIVEDQNEEDEDLLFLSSADFERELDEEDEYEVEPNFRPTEEEDREEDEPEDEDEDGNNEEGDQEEELDYDDNGYDDY